MKWRKMAPISIEGKRYFPAVWAEIFPDQEVLLVVQLTKWYFFKCIGATDCIGFTLTPDGRRKYVDEHWLMHEVGYP
ncbi:hypothetical protein [Alcanivorax sp. 1008]|uniref:hypothetical protein n=1 Tax=Alcanivorax sp. 1008 TaxID=2816853 RepID=UPI001D94DDE7|nr:hypothetical protein [Alcanivorax sp. 1008]MCC1496940.1 hypothetical protein [Alcanivorax sp. 1008]